MEDFTDYETVINNNSSAESSSSLFTVNHVPTGKLFHFQTIPSLAEINIKDKNILMNKLSLRKNLIHPNVLQFFDTISHNNVMYVKQEYCKYGTLKYFLQKECIEKERQLSEFLLCKFLYQIALALKTLDKFLGFLTLDTIFVDEDFNIKLYNFFNNENQFSKNIHNKRNKNLKMSQLGKLMFELCMLKNWDKENFEMHHFQAQLYYYSESFKNFIISLIKDNGEIKKHINKILCHSTILLQSNQWTKENCYVEKIIIQTSSALNKSKFSSSSSGFSEEDYMEKFEKIQIKETTLQIKENFLKEMERKLSEREIQLQIMERTVKEKLQQAEIYLKKCREKSTCSINFKSTSSLKPKIINYENSLADEDTISYISEEENDFFPPTSTKLQVDKIIKPTNFTRTKSERKIRFNVSPLKDRNFVKNMEKKTAKIQDIKRIHIPPSVTKKDSTLRKKIPFEGEVENIGWTQQTKKQAFEMLRILNNEQKENIDVKHTVL